MTTSGLASTRVVIKSQVAKTMTFRPQPPAGGHARERCCEPSSVCEHLFEQGLAMKARPSADDVEELHLGAVETIDLQSTCACDRQLQCDQS